MAYCRVNQAIKHNLLSVLQFMLELQETFTSSRDSCKQRSVAMTWSYPTVLQSQEIMPGCIKSCWNAFLLTFMLPKRNRPLRSYVCLCCKSLSQFGKLANTAALVSIVVWKWQKHLSGFIMYWICLSCSLDVYKLIFKCMLFSVNKQFLFQRSGFWKCLTCSQLTKS